jgi:hypothetical protein
VERAIVGFHVASTEAGEKRPASIAAHVTSMKMTAGPSMSA